jgi:hypothetical protein
VSIRWNENWKRLEETANLKLGNDIQVNFQAKYTVKDSFNKKLSLPSQTRMKNNFSSILSDYGGLNTIVRPQTYTKGLFLN